jgi:hypothetical protein
MHARTACCGEIVKASIVKRCRLAGNRGINIRQEIFDPALV